MKTKYIAVLSGSSWSVGPQAEFNKISDARAWAEEYGTTADVCSIKNRKGVEVARHKRSTEGNGMNWFRTLPENQEL